MNPPVTSTLQNVPSVQEDFKVDVGLLSVSVTISLVAVLIFILIRQGKFPGMRFRKGDRELDIGRADKVYTGPERRTTACTEIDMEAIRVTQLVARRRAEAHDAAWSQQKVYADEVEDLFWPILDRRGVDHWQVETAWARLHRVLASTADQNHILDHVKGEEINPDYLQDKVSLFQRRYDKLLSRTECHLPPFPLIEERIRALIADTLVRFARFAEDEDRLLSEFIEEMKGTTKNASLQQVIEIVGRRAPEAGQ